MGIGIHALLVARAGGESETVQRLSALPGLN